MALRSLIPRLVGKIHDDLITHPGWKSIRTMIQKKWIWSGMGEDIKEIVQACEKCQRYKKKRVRRTPIKMVSRKGLPFGHVCSDVMGPLPKTVRETPAS